MGVGVEESFSEEALSKERLVRQLSEARNYQSSIMAGAHSVLFILDLDGKFTNINPAGEELFGYKQEELLGEPFSILVPAAEIRRLKRGLQWIIDKRIIVEEIDLSFLRKNGSLYEANINVAPVLVESRVTGIVVSAIDITWRRRDQLLQRARWSLLDMLANGKELGEILSSLLAEVEKCYPLIHCSVSTIEQRTKKLYHIASPSLPDSFIQAVFPLETGLGAASCGTAAFIKKKVVVEEIDSHPLWENYREAAKAAGLGACWSQPIFGAGEKVLGVFAAYHREPRAPDENDMLLIEEYSQLVRMAIERKNMEEEILLRNREISLLYNIASAAGRTVEKKQLFQEIIHSIAERNDWGVKAQAKVFVLDEDELVLIYDSDQEQEGFKTPPCSRIQKGECLCGLAASQEEVIFCEDSKLDDRHTFQHEEKPHGHIVIPLTGKNGLNGVLCLYANVHMDMIDSSTRVMLTLAGHQIGMSLDNVNLYETLEKLSMNDPLTGLANRHYLQRYLEKNSIENHSQENLFSVILFDLDYFKKYNDTHGHAAGDRLLSKTGKILMQQTPPKGLAVRYGGEEFLVVLPGLGLKEAGALADQIRIQIMEETKVSTSAGVAGWSRKTQNFEEFAHCADTALYEAKKIRNCVVLFSGP